MAHDGAELLEDGIDILRRGGQVQRGGQQGVNGHGFGNAHDAVGMLAVDGMAEAGQGADEGLVHVVAVVDSGAGHVKDDEFYRH